MCINQIIKPRPLPPLHLDRVLHVQPLGQDVGHRDQAHEVVNVALNAARHAGVLHLHRSFPAVVQPHTVHLAMCVGCWEVWGWGAMSGTVDKICKSTGEELRFFHRTHFLHTPMPHTFPSRLADARRSTWLSEPCGSFNHVAAAKPAPRKPTLLLPTLP